MATSYVFKTQTPEGGAVGVQVTFKDTDGTSVVPSAVSWSLYNSANQIVNSRSGVSVSPAAQVVITMQGDDLFYNGQPLQVVVTYTYDSATLGAVTDKLLVKIPVENLP